MADVLSGKTHVKLPVVNFVLLIVAIAGVIWTASVFMFSFKTDIKENHDTIAILDNRTGVCESSIDDLRSDNVAVATRVTILEVQYSSIIKNQEAILGYLKDR